MRPTYLELYSPNVIFGIEMSVRHSLSSDIYCDCEDSDFSLWLLNLA